MSDMSFKQTKELIERFELAELTLKNTIDTMDHAAKSFKKSLKTQEHILNMIPKQNEKLSNIKFVVGLNIGLIVGVLIGKFLF
jgi:hypothetical protein